MSSRRGQTSSNQTGGSSNSSGTFCDPETERKYLSKISSGHQELSDFICGKRPNPPAPSDIAPFYMGGAAGCRHDLDLVSGSWSIAKILYERSKLRSKSLLPQQLSPKARDEVGNIRRQLFLGSQVNCDCTQPFLTHGPSSHNRQTQNFTRLMESLALNQSSTSRNTIFYLHWENPDDWRRKMNCKKQDCVQFSERCQDITFNSDSYTTINKDDHFKAYRGLCINMSSGLIGHEYQHSSCDKDPHYKTVNDPSYLEDLERIHSFRGRTNLSVNEAAELSQRCDRRRRIWTENHTGANSHHLNLTPREERVFD